MSIADNKGFTLAEFVIAIVLIGVVLGPFLVFVARIHDLNSAVGQQARREAWRSFNDQAVAAGIDPTTAPALSASLNIAIPNAPRLAVAAGNATASAGLPLLVTLQVLIDGSVAETRMPGAGLQIGAGPAVAPRGTPTSPLLPIVMPAPVVTPADGTVIASTALVPAAIGDPYTTNIQAASSAGTKVLVQLNQPYATAAGSGVVQQSVNAVDLMNRVSGVAWSEYPGDASAGDKASALGDGRTRWFITRQDGRQQIYEPSAPETFAYHLGLGAPILTRGAEEQTPGATLGFDYSDFSSVQIGATALRIDFPRTTKSVFGTKWAEQTVGFQATFNQTPAPFSGDLKAFFSTDSLSLWTDSFAVTATPIVPTGAVADSGTWTFHRVKSALGAPLLSSVADSSGFYTPGEMQFTAPKGPDGTAIGRLSFNYGANLSTGTTLSLSVIP